MIFLKNTSTVIQINGVDVIAGVPTIVQGQYGSLSIESNGTFTYISNGLKESSGKSETFTYTISDGIRTDDANLIINIKDIVAPDAPIINPVNGEDTITGTGEVGSTITITLPNGETLETIVLEDGTWTIENPGLEHNAIISVVSTDAANNSSTSVVINVDALAPDVPTGQFSENGDVITGTAEAGSTVVVKTTNGDEVARVVVDENGQYRIDDITPPYINGEELNITSIDQANNISITLPIIAPLNDYSLKDKDVKAFNNEMTLVASVEPKVSSGTKAEWQTTSLLSYNIGLILDTTKGGGYIHPLKKVRFVIYKLMVQYQESH